MKGAGRVAVMEREANRTRLLSMSGLAGGNINTSDYTLSGRKHQVALLKPSAFLLNYCEL